jgi:hypothetical protein
VKFAEGWYNQVTMPEAPRIAQPGDIFILLIPAGPELDQLRRAQAALQSQYGGKLIDPIHITVERFSPGDGYCTQDCIPPIKKDLRGVQPFPIYTDALIQFFAPYWQSQVLRWRVADAPIWNDFRDLLESTLSEIGCPSHFVRRRHATCTILKLDGEIDLPSGAQEFSMPLFTARQVLFSMLKEDGLFEIIDHIELGDSHANPKDENLSN